MNLDFIEIIETISSKTGKSYEDISKELGKNKGYLTQTKSRYLKGEPLPANLIDILTLRYGNVLQNDKNYLQERLNKKNNGEKGNVMVYDVDFIAGTQIETFDDLSENTPSYSVFIPAFDGCTGFNVYNDSMEPKIKSGSLVFARQITDYTNNFEYGNIFGIVLQDGRRLLKYLKKHTDESKLLAVSENDHYDDMDIVKKDIKSVWQIEGWINRKS